PGLTLKATVPTFTEWLVFIDQWDPKSPWADRRVRLAANLAIDRKALNESEYLGFARAASSIIPRDFQFFWAAPPYPHDPARARQLLAEAGYPRGFDAGDLTTDAVYAATGEAVINDLRAVGVRADPRARVPVRSRATCRAVGARHDHRPRVRVSVRGDPAQAPTTVGGRMTLPTHGRYDYSNITKRPDYTWPNGARLAVYVAVNIEAFGFGVGKGVAIAPPDQAMSASVYSWRDYGNRVGVWRLFDLFDELNLPVEAQLNLEVYEAAPDIAERLRKRGDEIVGHGVTNSEGQEHMLPDEERA